MLVSIIIVNYNTAKHLRECLYSIDLYLNSVEKEIIVADNNSPEREIEKIAEEYKNVKFIFRRTNDGFGTGCNDAVNVSKGKYLLFLNPDIRLIDNSIKILIDNIENSEDSGVYSGLLTDKNKNPIYCYNKFPDLLWEFYHFIGFGYERQIEKLLQRKEISEGKEFSTDWFHGAFLLIKKIDFLSVGGFDENYFMYYEDVELCYRVIKKLNKKNICFPEVRIYHHTQSSLESEKTDDVYIFHMHRGKLIFIKNYNLLKKNSIWLLGLISVILRIILLPLWTKYKGKRKFKFYQLSKVLKLYINKEYLNKSKYEYINK